LHRAPSRWPGCLPCMLAFGPFITNPEHIQKNWRPRKVQFTDGENILWLWTRVFTHPAHVRKNHQHGGPCRNWAFLLGRWHNGLWWLSHDVTRSFPPSPGMLLWLHISYYFINLLI
jgi:hypothetical protein